MPGQNASSQGFVVRAGSVATRNEVVLKIQPNVMASGHEKVRNFPSPKFGHTVPMMLSTTAHSPTMEARSVHEQGTSIQFATISCEQSVCKCESSLKHSRGTWPHVRFSLTCSIPAWNPTAAGFDFFVAPDGDFGRLFPVLLRVAAGIAHSSLTGAWGPMLSNYS